MRLLSPLLLSLVLCASAGLAEGLAEGPAPRLVPQSAHHAELVAVALSENGALAASVDATGAVRVWHVDTGKVILRRQWLIKPGARPARVAAAPKAVMPKAGVSKEGVSKEGAPALAQAGASTPGAIRALSLQEGLVLVADSQSLRAWDVLTGEELELPQDIELPPASLQASSLDGARRIDGEGGLEVFEGEASLRALRGGAVALTAAEWRGDGLRLLTADGALRAWSAEGVARPALPTGVADALDFCATEDGAQVMLASAQGPARVLSLDDGAELQRFQGHDRQLTALATSPTEALALSGGREGGVLLWDLKRQSLRRALPPHAQSITALAVSSGGLAASAGAEGLARLVDLETGAVVAELSGHEDVVVSLAFSPDGATLLGGDRRGQVYAWDSEGALLWSTAVGGAVGALAFTPDGAAFVAGGGRGVSLRQVSDGALLQELEGHEASITALAVSPDGLALLSGDSEGGLSAWSLPDGARTQIVAAHEGAVRLLAWHGEGVVVSGGRRGGVSVWRPDLSLIKRGPKASVVVGGLAADGRTMILGRPGAAMGLWEGSVFLGRLEGDARGAAVVAVVPDGEVLITGGADGTLRTWHAASGSMFASVRHRGAVTALDLSADGERAASGDARGGLLSWPVDSTADLRELDGVGASVRALRWSPDAETLWVGDAEGALHQVPMGKQGERQTWAAHAGALEALALSPDGAALLTGGVEGLARLWDAAAATPGEAWELGAPVLDAAWSPSGARLLLMAEDHVQLREADGALRCTLIVSSEGALWVDASGRYEGDAALGFEVVGDQLRSLQGAPREGVARACLAGG